MKLETWEKGDLYVLYVQKLGRPCVFIDLCDIGFHELASVPLFKDLPREALESVLRHFWCVVSFESERDAVMWTAKIAKDQKMPINATLYAADGTRLLSSYDS